MKRFLGGFYSKSSLLLLNKALGSAVIANPAKTSVNVSYPGKCFVHSSCLSTQSGGGDALFLCQPLTGKTSSGARPVHN